MKNVKMDNGRRIRMELTIHARVRDGQKELFAVTDKKMIALRVLMQERFGGEGQAAFEDWLCHLYDETSHRRGEPDEAA